MSKTHKIALTVGAAMALKQLLESLSWYKDGNDFWRAGQILERAELDVGAPPKEPEGRPAPGDRDPAKHRAWEDAWKAFEKGALEPWLDREVVLDDVTEKQRATLQTCLKHYLGQGGISNTKHSRRLVGELGLQPED
jgi:hypothetical protein